MGARDLLDRAINGSGIGRFALNRNRNRLRILCYHGIWAEPGPHFGNKLFMSAAKFEARLTLIRALGLEVLPMREAIRALRERKLPPRAAVITIDDGWATTFSHMLPALERHQLPATIYVQTERIEADAPVADVALRYAFENTTAPELSLDDMPIFTEATRPVPLDNPSARQRAFATIEPVFARTPVTGHRALLVELFSRLGVDAHPLAQNRAFDLGRENDLLKAHESGFEIALHTHTHNLGDFSRDTLNLEITRNRECLSRILGLHPDSFRHFCWPSGDYTFKAGVHVRELGVDIATTCDFGLAHEYSDSIALPRILDGQETSDEAFLVGVSGIQQWVDRLTAFVRAASARPAKRAEE